MGIIGIIGHFAFGIEYLNGQTVKTKIIADTLSEIYGSGNINMYDTHGGAKFFAKILPVLVKVLFSNKNIVIMPAHKGVRIILPILSFINLFFRRRILYVVIGGWLPELLRKNRILKFIVKNTDAIFVETTSMKEKLIHIGLNNVVVMPNCKQLPIIELPAKRSADGKFPLCIFSRVIKEKGIEEAIIAVKTANKNIGKDVYSLDIYGQTDKRQQGWFDSLISNQPDYIRYCGCVDYDKSVDTLKKYYALLFPTYYEGEGFAGTIIDAFAAGLPVLASDWHDNASIISDGDTGFIYPIKDPKAIAEILVNTYKNPAEIEGMRQMCINEAKKYQPAKVVSIMKNYIKE